MGQYKVPQNVEAEDHILGPMTFKQFIYMLVGGGWGVLCFVLLNKLPVVMIVLGGPPTLLFMLLAFYNRDGQDFEHLLVAVVGYFAASRYRLWVKEELNETFHVEPAQHVNEVSQRNPAQVISELEKLATLIDSRGWNLPPSADTGSHLTMPTTAQTDRIVSPPPSPPHPIEAPHTDILDQNSPLAQNLALLLQQAAIDVRQQAMSQMALPQAGQRIVPATATAGSISGVTGYPTNDILRLATQSDDLSVASVAAQATRIYPAYPAQPAQPAPVGAPVQPMVEPQNYGS